MKTILLLLTIMAVQDQVIQVEELPASGFEGKTPYYLRHPHIIITTEFEPVVTETNKAWRIEFKAKAK